MLRITTKAATIMGIDTIPASLFNGEKDTPPIVAAALIARVASEIVARVGVLSDPMVIVWDGQTGAYFATVSTSSSAGDWAVREICKGADVDPFALASDTVEAWGNAQHRPEAFAIAVTGAQSRIAAFAGFVASTL